MSQERKYNRVIGRSKHLFPTVFTYKAGVVVGAERARKDIERQLGHSIAHWKPAHTRTEWRWKKPRGMCSDKSREPKPKAA